jgi:tape measure domain-containing protein
VAEGLGSAVLTLSVDETAFQAGLDRAKQAANNFGQQVGRSLAGVGSGQTLAGLTIKLNSLQGELQRVSIGSVRFRELRKEIEATEKALSKASGAGRAGIIGNVATGLAGLGIGAASFRFIRQSIDGAIELETVTRKLSNTLGQDGATKALAFTKRLANELGESFRVLSNSFAGFTAAATTAGVPLEEQRSLFESVATSAQRLGLSNDELQGSLLALQQVASKGTVQMEELRGQLGERLPIALGATANGLGITQQELIKLVESGRFASRDFFQALSRGLDDFNASGAGAPTTAQNIQKLGNAWDQLQTSFGQNLLPTVTESVKVFRDVVDGLGRKQIADRLGFNTGAIGLFGRLSDGAIEAAEAFKRIQSELDLTDKQATALFFDARKSAGILPFQDVTPGQSEKLIKEFERIAGAWRDRFPLREPIIDETANDTSLNTIAKIRERLKTLQSERIGLDVDSSRFNEVGREIQELQRKLSELEKPINIQAGSLAGINAQVQEARSVLESLNPANESFFAALSRYESANDALRSASNAVERAFAVGADGVLRATQGAQQVLRGAFDLLRPELRRQLVNQARSQINFGVFSRAAIGNDPSRIFQAADASRQLFQIDSSKLDSSLGNLGQTFQQQTSVLNDTLSNLNGVITLLAGKDWNVNVNVGADGSSNAYGDVLNGALP